MRLAWRVSWLLESCSTIRSGRGGGSVLRTRVGDTDDRGVAFLLQGVLRLLGVRGADHHPGCVVVRSIDCERFIRDHDIRRSVGLSPWWGHGGRHSLLWRNLASLPCWDAWFLAKVPWLKFLKKLYVNKDIRLLKTFLPEPWTHFPGGVRYSCCISSLPSLAGWARKGASSRTQGAPPAQRTAHHWTGQNQDVLAGGQILEKLNVIG